MSRSPYGVLMNTRPTSSGKNAPLRQSAPAPADGALSGEGSGGWGLNNMLRTSAMNLVTPRPPSSEPSPPPGAGPASGGPGAAKSPMAFRARRFNHASSGSDSDLSASLPFPSPSTAATTASSTASSLPDPNRRRSGTTENPPPSSPSGNSSGQPLLASSPIGGSLGRQLSATSTSSSSVSIRPSTSPAGNILASFNGQSINASPDGSSPIVVASGVAGVAAGPPSKALRPKSSETNVSNSGGGSTASTTASSSGSKVLRNRLSEDAAGGHAAGAPTLSLREKVAILQRNNKALEQQLAEAASEAQQRAAQQAEAHQTALSGLQQRVTALEAQLAAQQRAAAELAVRNQQLTEAQVTLQAQLAAATAAAAAAAAAARAPPPRRDAAAEVCSSELLEVPSAAAVVVAAALPYKATVADGGGPVSPRTPLVWDGLPPRGGGGSPGSSSASSHDSIVGGGGPGGATESSPPSPSHLQHMHSGGSSGGSFKNIVLVDDMPPPHPHIVWPGSPTADGAAPSTATATSTASPPPTARPHTALHANYVARGSLHAGGGANATPALSSSQTYDGSIPSESTSLLLVASHSEPDVAAPPPMQSPPGGGRRSTHPGASAAAHSVAAGGGDIYLAGAGPPPASPVAAAAGLSGAGVALLARQKKLIATLRSQLQQKDSAYAFLANEHAELEGQLKEVEAAKREYAARYAFMVLDQDLDGHIRVDQVGSFDMFGCYSGAVLEYAFKHWRFASGFKGYLNMDDFVKFVTLSDDRTSRDSQRFWFGVLDLDGDGAVSAEDARWFYDSVDKDESAFVVGFEDLWHQLLDMTQPANKQRGFTSVDLWRCKLGAGVIGLLLNHNMLLHRTTAEWGRGDFPL